MLKMNYKETLMNTQIFTQSIPYRYRSAQFRCYANRLCICFIIVLYPQSICYIIELSERHFNHIEQCKRFIAFSLKIFVCKKQNSFIIQVFHEFIRERFIENKKKEKLTNVSFR